MENKDIDNQNIENENTKNDGTWDLVKKWYTLFYGIAFISFINTIFLLLGVDLWIVFWLWITEYIRYLSLHIDVFNTKIIYIIVSVLISSLFLLIWYLTKKKIKIILELGIILYILDTLIYVYYFDFIWIISHIILIKLLYDYYWFIFKIDEKDNKKDD